MKRVLLCLALVFPFSAFAAEKVEYYFAPYSDHSRVPFQIFTQKQCLATLKDLFVPEATIGTGLNALFANQEFRAGTTSCLSDTLQDWGQLFAPPDYVEEQLEEAGELTQVDYAPIRREVEEMREKLVDELECRYEDAPQKSQCKGKKISDKRAEALQKQLENLDNVLSLKMRQLEAFQNPVETIATLMLERPNSKKLQELKRINKILDCDYYREDKGCSGKKLSDSQLKKLEAERAALDKQVDKENEANSRAGVGAENYLRFALHHGKINRAQLGAVARQAVCYVRDKTSESDVEEKKQICGGKILSDAEANKLRQSVRALAKDYDDLAPNWEMRKIKYVDEQAMKNLPKHAAFVENISHRSLLSSYHAFLAKKTNESTEKFCLENEAAQRRDASFFNSMPNMPARMADLLNASPGGFDEPEGVLFGLTRGENLAVRSFTGTFYEVINPMLWNRTASEGVRNYVESMKAALNRLPSYKEGPVLRFANLPDSVLKEHALGKVVCYRAFTSTSRDPAWSWEGKHRFSIYGANGKMVEKVSASESEKEVLFPPNSCFKVLKRENNADTEGVDFVMAEVDKNGKVIATIPKDEPQKSESPKN